jgi:2-polyprenyl-6-methoxyphenol hydroxylase-like FAD-dependent oxidoreductase
VLLDGLGDVVEFGRTFERYELTGDGQVVAHFSDGSSASGDLLVGADGAKSRVRQQLLPHAKRMDTGVRAVAGKFHLTEASRARLPAELTTRVNAIVPARRGFLFTAVWQGDRQPVTSALSGHEIGGNDETAVRQPGLLFDNTADYTFWAYADSAHRLLAGRQLDRCPGAALQQAVLDEIQGWSPHLRRLVAESDAATVNAITVRSATPVDPWPTMPVTLLGDAIHNMTPMGGIGANTALRDADLLCRQLIAVHRGRQALVPAVHEYERQMLDYGFAAVKTSLRTARLAGSANPIARRALRGILRLANVAPSAKRRMFSDIGQRHRSIRSMRALNSQVIDRAAGDEPGGLGS